MLTKLLDKPDAGRLEMVSLVERRQLVPQAGIGIPETVVVKDGQQI